MEFAEFILDRLREIYDGRGDLEVADHALWRTTKNIKARAEWNDDDMTVLRRIAGRWRDHPDYPGLIR
ncbi:hypothetical protein FOS14_09775 [Skermania sp. ID1734]|uniref:hypothetical protein n=1 Tax=Skermania sp. ID1734 TaxID=2597516 RepID=UPI00117EACE2|nr:hypothetical protein [Skermania sp. ID1734]TSE00092.1 hypothetical protein FOS14_09775 [Skermania sp. ID1734]